MPVRRFLAPLLCVLSTLVVAPAAHAAKGMESTFQDDDQLIYNTPAGQAATLRRLKALGVDRIRVTLLWKQIAPDPKSTTRPDFNAADPNAYPDGAWAPYDRLDVLAQQLGIGVNFEPTAPAPLWATGSPQRADIKETYAPRPDEYGAFVQAAATRYNGQFVPAKPVSPAAAAPAKPTSPIQVTPGGGLRATTGASTPLPRVNYWSIWNEPNQPGWLTPQYLPDARSKTGYFVEESPNLYRALVDAGVGALYGTGHQADTILIGETAPKGVSQRNITRAMAPGLFIRDLYCLDSHLQYFKGTTAQIRGCPPNNTGANFVAAHPGLFKLTGYAHHPYELTFAPNHQPGTKDWYTMANLGQLDDLLGRIFQRYGQPLPGGAKKMPLYLTEFGYQSDPPDPFGVSPTQQAAYINQAQYIAWSNRNVKTLSQFLFVDSKPIGGDYQSNFQSGIEKLDHAHKPAYAAYAMPIYLPKTTSKGGHRFRVWGQARVAPKTPGQTVTIEGHRKGSSKFAKLRTFRTSVKGNYVGTVTVHGTGSVRASYTDASGHTSHSRSVSVTVK